MSNHVIELPKILDALGLSKEDYSLIEHILGRSPTHTELAMFSVEWSEHCSYRRSKHLIKQFPKEGRFPILVGEDAGGFLIGDLAVIFKVESHNHPSQVEPVHGAATGVGGIIRDILGSGARPIAVFDSLRFGPISKPACRETFTGVINGIQWYGNCIGVPTVGGEVYFHPDYETNCLVNVMCVGVAHKSQLVTSKAVPGCIVLYLGARTGRDGIGGCSVLASQELNSEIVRRPEVQIGDPFFGKCLIEATLECLEKKLFVSLKDMGAAGLTCTTTEMSKAGNCGMEIELANVPKREEKMEPFEIMMSESQERMLAVVEKDKVEDVMSIYKKWGLEAEIIGRTILAPYVKIFMDNIEVANVPVNEITSPIPIHLPVLETSQLPVSETPHIPSKASKAGTLGVTDNCSAKFYDDKLYENYKSKVTTENALKYLLSLLSHPTISSKRWIWEQYDHMVQTNTIVLPGNADASVLRLKGQKEVLAVTMDGNPHYTILDPYLGAQLAVAEAARNLISVGALPAACTNCLNFGTPEKPERFWTFVRAAEGIRDACKELSIPVVSGNVSFYNESGDNAIPPSPIIGMVGVINKSSSFATIPFKEIGDEIFLIGDETGLDFGGSYIQIILDGKESGTPPKINWENKKRLMVSCLEGIKEGFVLSSHDCSEGGAGVALAECMLEGKKGAKVSWPYDPILFFSETQSRIIVSVNPKKSQKLQELLKNQDVSFIRLGEVTSMEDGLSISWGSKNKFTDTISFSKLQKAFEDTIPRILKCNIS